MSNKVKYGLKNVHWALIKSYDSNGLPIYDDPKSHPGSVSISFSHEGDAENFYADDGVYYVINNNSGYSGDLEVALVTTDFLTDILSEIIDDNGVLVESADAELKQFALMFEFTGDKKKIRHVFYCCSASRTDIEGDTTQENKEVKTEKLSIKAAPLANGLVKSKSCEVTDTTVYNDWYQSVYMPTISSTPSAPSGPVYQHKAYIG